VTLWTFLFPDGRYQSARVAAPDKGAATVLLGSEIDLPDAVIVQWGGELGDVAPAVLETVERAAP